LDAALKRVRSIVFPPQIEVGEIYDGVVKNIQAFGAFVEILPKQEALLHVSEIVENVRDFLKEGDKVKVKVIGKDPKKAKTRKTASTNCRAKHFYQNLRQLKIENKNLSD